jgi:hypothetical protein
MKAGAKVTYFPGTNIARMRNRAGVNARLGSLKDSVKDFKKDLTKAVGRAAHDTGQILGAIENDVLIGLLQGAVLIQDDMDKTPPLMPIDTGALHAGFKIRPKESGVGIGVEAGWYDTIVEKTDPKTGKTRTVDQYAAYVHEMTSPPYGPINWSKLGSGPKFLEASFKRNSSKIIKGVTANIKRSLI